jgi:hypothetical protein
MNGTALICYPILTYDSRGKTSEKSEKKTELLFIYLPTYLYLPRRIRHIKCISKHCRNLLFVLTLEGVGSATVVRKYLNIFTLLPVATELVGPRPA